MNLAMLAVVLNASTGGITRLWVDRKTDCISAGGTFVTPTPTSPFHSSNNICISIVQTETRSLQCYTLFASTTGSISNYICDFYIAPNAVLYVQ